jgi:hypothetical protein
MTAGIPATRAAGAQEFRGPRTDLPHRPPSDGGLTREGRAPTRQCPEGGDVRHGKEHRLAAVARRRMDELGCDRSAGGVICAPRSGSSEDWP